MIEKLSPRNLVIDPITGKVGWNDYIAAPIDDSDLVHKTGDEVIEGLKTFSELRVDEGGGWMSNFGGGWISLFGDSGSTMIDNTHIIMNNPTTGKNSWLTPYSLFFHDGIYGVELKGISEMTHNVTLQLPNKDEGEHTIATLSDFKTVNGASIIGSGDIVIDDTTPTLDEVVLAGQTSTESIIISNAVNKKFRVESPSGSGELRAGSMSLTNNGVNAFTIDYLGVATLKTTNIAYPTKPAGTLYTLATTDDVSVPVSASVSGIVNNTALQELG